MYYDSKEHRLLLRNGQSVVSDFDMALMILNGETSGTVVKSDDAFDYEDMYGDVIYSDVDGEITPQPNDHAHTDAEYDFVVDRIMGSPRFEYENSCLERIQTEMEFFVRTENVKFLVYLINLIDRFKKEGVIWGVGRGSSCSSYIMYLLEVNDINPLKYKIPFNELSKE